MFGASKTKQVSSAANYVEDVFSTYLYTGTGVDQSINNGIDLATKGGLTWIKSRSLAANNGLYDTNRGAGYALVSNSVGAQGIYHSYLLNSFNTNGFTVGTGTDVNSSGDTFASWTFRKQPKFFDVVTWTGDNTASRVISHSLASTPGVIIIKEVSSSGNWSVCAYAALGASSNLTLNNTDPNTPNGTQYVVSAASSTTFTLGTVAGSKNTSGVTYIAYLFAHNAGGFGLTGTDNVISCGSFTTDASGLFTPVNLGYEPQWILCKRTDSTGNWFLFDNMRGLALTSLAYLYPNLSNAESTATDGRLYPTATGFAGSASFGASSTYIYIAIRRGPMKVPTDATKVYATSTSDTVNNPEYISNFPVDMEISANTLYGSNRNTSSRLLQGTYLYTNSTAAEAAGSQYDFAYNNGWATNAVHDSAYRSWMFQRAPSFFDEVCYTGDGTIGRQINHNLAAVPELMIVKARTSASSNLVGWRVYNATIGATKYLNLNNTSAATVYSDWADTAPTSTVFTVYGGGTSYNTTNQSGIDFVNYLFASCPGVSKVGSYTGNGTTQTINCGFAGGARFVLIKRTDSTGDWYVYDTARGMTTLTDPYLLLNSTAAESATLGSVTTVTTGFAVNASILAAINTNGASYIFLAIA